jgi:hypothetical protein
MNYSKTVFAVCIILLLAVAPITQGKENGKLNSGTGCGCHSQPGANLATPSVSGLPSAYTPGSVYQLTVSVTGGVSGSGGGFSMDVDKGTFSYFGFAVGISSTGDSATHSITGSSSRTWGFDWTAPSSGSGAANFQLAALTSNGNGADSGDRWGTLTIQVLENAPTNQAPSASNAMLTPTDAKTADSLTLSYSYSDPDGNPESGTVITWYKDSIAQPQGTIPGKVVSSSLTAKNEQWYAEVTPSDGQDSGQTITSNTVTIQNTPPTVSTPAISPSQPSSNDDLSITISSSDDDQDVLTTEIRWYLDGALVSELNDQSTVTSLATRDGDQWYVEIRVSDGEDTTVWKTSQTVTIGSTAPVNNKPTISTLTILPSNPYTIDTLSLDFLSNDIDGDTIVDTEIQWYRNGVLMPSITTTTLSSEQTSKSEQWGVHVRINDGTEWSDWEISSSVTILNTAPELDSISLDFSQAQTSQNITLSLSMSDLDGDAPASPETRWYKNGQEFTSIENQITLPSSLTSKGDNWTVFVRADDGQEFSMNELSTSVEIINTIPNAIVELSHTSLEDLVLSVTNDDIDGDLVSNEITWYRNGFKEGSLDGQSSVPAQLLGPGQVWSVDVIPNDGESNGSMVSSQITIENLAPTAQIDVESEKLWDGEEIKVSAQNSTDSDGRIETYSWQWSDNNGNSGTGSGKEYTFIPNGMVTLTLTVYDELGSNGYTSINLQTEAGPKVTSLEAYSMQEQVTLSWSWSGPEATFEILRNGDSITVISELEFVDTPLISGPTDYTIRPIIDGQGLHSGSSTIEGFMVETIEPTESSVSTTGGLITGLLFIILSIGSLSLIFIDRRD